MEAILARIMGDSSGQVIEHTRRIAYFSMEIGLESAVPTYSGGLGVLAGDTLRSTADLRVPIVAVSLVHRKGYFSQSLSADGTQSESEAIWPLEQHVQKLSPIVSVNVENRTVQVQAWRYVIHGHGGHRVPVYLLDTDLPQNHPDDRTLTDHLYGGDQRYRLAQEAVLGIAGVRMLRALGYVNLRRFHMNEGHAALLTLELLNEHMTITGRTSPTRQDLDAVKRRCVFTTHTPVPAGHDQFPMELVNQVLGHNELFGAIGGTSGTLNMTHLALNLSHFVNGVAKRHGEVSREMFAGYPIDSITNGVHAGTWAAPSFAQLFDRRLSDWRADNYALRHALRLPLNEVWDAHMQAKRLLLERINSGTSAGFSEDVFTIGFARRAATYKRTDLLVSDVARLKAIAAQHGVLQIVFAGKAHPRDGGGKDMIKRIHEAIPSLGPQVKVVYLPNYAMELGKLITAGVDLWVNTPQRPMEASGTSGMKSALNGVPSLSILDGWWVEGWIENVTGWSIGDSGLTHGDNGDHSGDASAMFDKLQQVILPMYLHQRDRYVEIMRNCIAYNGSFFNTHRMVSEYVVKAYLA